MLIEILKSKIHRATVTSKNIHYVGSITVDEKLLKAAGMRENEKVHVFNLNTGSRFETYLIKGKAGSGQICINGAASRLAESGDLVIMISYGFMDEKQANVFMPKVVYVDAKNKIKKVTGKEKPNSKY
ncbi:MAG: aspartate 1-decarboxylase [bacterium]